MAAGSHLVCFGRGTLELGPGLGMYYVLLLDQRQALFSVDACTGTRSNAANVCWQERTFQSASAAVQQQCSGSSIKWACRFTLDQTHTHAWSLHLHATFASWPSKPLTCQHKYLLDHKGAHISSCQPPVSSSHSIHLLDCCCPTQSQPQQQHHDAALVASGRRSIASKQGPAFLHLGRQVVFYTPTACCSLVIVAVRL